MAFRVKSILSKVTFRDWKSISVLTLAGLTVSFLAILNLYFPLWTRPNTLSSDDLLLSKGITPGPALKLFRDCPSNHTYFLPCQDPSVAIRFKRIRNEFRERHCPSPEKRLRCLIPSPQNYKRPVPWPKSRDKIWRVNVPHTNIYKNKLNKAWMDMQDDYWIFRGFGTMFPRGIDQYLERLQSYVPLKSGKIRTALDIGCGVGTFGASLLDYGILTMSIAPKDFNKGQTEFALERGIPALVALLATQRLTFPSRAFDLIQCARCNVDFLEDDGVYLLEVDRLLRPEGYFVLGGPPVNWNGSETSWAALSALTQRMCWNPVAIDGNIAIWQKPANHKCVLRRTPGTEPSLCPSHDDPDNSWKRKLQPCIARMSNLEEVKPWPARLVASPIRFPPFSNNVKGKSNKTLSTQEPGSEKNNVEDSSSGGTGDQTIVAIEGRKVDAEDENGLDQDESTKDVDEINEDDKTTNARRLLLEGSRVMGDRRAMQEDMLKQKSTFSRRQFKIQPLGPVSQADLRGFSKDIKRWRKRIKFLKFSALRTIKKGHLRNIMDMNAGFGGFAASLDPYPVWVMNVVPITEPNTLPVIYDRGLIGVAHDWCEAFSTYPRTYDLIHAVNMQGFIIAPKRCNILDVFIEMDRILRPGGKIIVRDTARALSKIIRVARAVGWVVNLFPSEDGLRGKDLLLIGDKPMYKQ